METKRLTYLEVTLAISQLSPEDRKKLRENFDFIESWCDPKVMEELTRNNREAREGKVYTREQALELLERARKSVA
jgi:hypothetical protein